MAQPILYMAGVDRTDWLAAGTASITRNINGIADMRMSMRQAGRTSWAPRKRMEVLLEQGTIRRFAGTVYSVEAHVATGSDGRAPGLSNGLMEWGVICVDYNHALVRRLWKGTIPAGTTLYSAVSSIADVSLTGENISLTGVENPGPTLTEDVDADQELVKDVFSRISTLTGGYLFYIDFFKTLHFSQFQPNPGNFTCTETSDNWRNMRLTRSDEFYVNRQYVRTERSL